MRWTKEIPRNYSDQTSSRCTDSDELKWFLVLIPVRWNLEWTHRLRRTKWVFRIRMDYISNGRPDSVGLIFCLGFIFEAVRSLVSLKKFFRLITDFFELKFESTILIGFVFEINWGYNVKETVLNSRILKTQMNFKTSFKIRFYYFLSFLENK